MVEKVQHRRYGRLQSYLGAIDGATALSIGWHLSVVGQLYQAYVSQTMRSICKRKWRTCK